MRGPDAFGGKQHADNAKDQIGEVYLAAEGYQTIRFWNNDVLTNTNGVLIAILTRLNS